MGIVPLSLMIETENSALIYKNVLRIKKLIETTGKPVAIVVDAGLVYQKLKNAYADYNIPLFSSIQDVFGIIK